MSDVVLSVENVSKRFRIGAKPHAGTLREAISAAGSAAIQAPGRFFSGSAQAGPADDEPRGKDYDEFWALRDVSFEVRRGEVLGIIGRNGAGKSTLLKIISRITEPTTGRVGIRGRVGSLLEVGTGFHPDLTGRENIFLNGKLLGMSRSEIRQKFDEIVDFSGVEQFIDTPVKRYSSGMTVRLGFAVATIINPELLILDEVLTVGDAEFQAKCSARIQQAMRTGDRAVVIVSHNMASIANLADRCLLMEAGHASVIQSPAEAVTRYLPKATTQSVYIAGPSDRRPAQIRRVEVVDEDDRVIEQHHDQAKPFCVRVRVLSEMSLPEGYVAVYLRDQTDTPVIFTDQRDTMRAGIARGEATYSVTFPGRLIKAGTYWVTAGIAENPTGRSLDTAKDRVAIVLETTDEPHRKHRAGFFGAHLRWHVAHS